MQSRRRGKSARGGRSCGHRLKKLASLSVHVKGQRAKLQEGGEPPSVDGEPNGGCGCDVESVVLEAFLRAVVGPAHRCEEPRVEGDRSDKGCHQGAGGVRVVLVRFRRDGQAQAPAGEHTRLGGLQGRGEGSFDSVDGALDQSLQWDFLRGEAVGQTAFADSRRPSDGVEREGGGT